MDDFLQMDDDDLTRWVNHLKKKPIGTSLGKFYRCLGNFDFQD